MAIMMNDEVFDYGSVTNENNGGNAASGRGGRVPEGGGDVGQQQTDATMNGKIVGEEAIVIKVDDPAQRPKPIRSHRGHVRTGSSVEDHPPLYAKDSAYLISERSPSRQRQLLVENWKLVIVAVSLCILGVGLVITGIVVESLSLEHVRSFVFYIAGAICLIPGVYHMVYIYFALKGKQGYNLANLPVFNWT